MRLTFLGTGTSFGVPVVGCTCTTCTSLDPRDRRTRHSALLQLTNGSLLIDTPPELRLQLLAAGVAEVGAVWITHSHADHVHGLDDLRVFTTRNRRDLDVYVGAGEADQIVARFPYVFDERVRPPRGTSKPRIRLHPLDADLALTLLGDEITPVAVPHGAHTVLGLRVGDLGYVTDAKTLPAAALRALRGVRVLVLNALWYGNPHPTHFNVEEALEAAAEVGAEVTYLTHLTHRLGHAELLDRLPTGVLPAYDGLSIEV